MADAVFGTLSRLSSPPADCHFRSVLRRMDLDMETQRHRSRRSQSSTCRRCQRTGMSRQSGIIFCNLTFSNAISDPSHHGGWMQNQTCSYSGVACMPRSPCPALQVWLGFTVCQVHMPMIRVHHEIHEGLQLQWMILTNQKLQVWPVWLPRLWSPTSWSQLVMSGANNSLSAVDMEVPSCHEPEPEDRPECSESRGRQGGRGRGRGRGCGRARTASLSKASAKRKCRHPASTAGSRLPPDGRESLEPATKSRRSKSCRGGEKAKTWAPRRKSPSPNPWEQPPPVGQRKLAEVCAPGARSSPPSENSTANTVAARLSLKTENKVKAEPMAAVKEEEHSDAESDQPLSTLFPSTSHACAAQLACS